MSNYAKELADWLADPNRSHWDTHPDYLAYDWQCEVADNATRQSYTEWAMSRAEARDDEESVTDDNPVPVHRWLITAYQYVTEATTFNVWATDEDEARERAYEKVADPNLDWERTEDQSFDEFIDSIERKEVQS